MATRPHDGLPPTPRGKRLPQHGGDGYFEARRLLEGVGIEFVEARRAASATAAIEAADAIGYPVVVKAVGRTHKSDAGGVRVDIRRRAELRAALAEMRRRLSPAEYSVERMSSPPGAVELLVGARRDHAFGPVLLVGAGGVLAEVLSDFAVAIAPVSPRQAERLIRSLRISPALTGARGGARLDLAGAARAASALSKLAAAWPDIAELEINPLQVARDGCLALDARVVWSLEGSKRRPSN
jgi:acyl-CoA synthetase (NDP forming)